MRKRNQGTTRCAIYLRCSTDDQKEGDFTTLDTQREINTAYVREKGWIFAGEYADEGKSGTNLNRAGWKRLLADAEAGLLDVVVVTYMSRLGRGNPFTNAEYELDKHGVRVEMVREKFDNGLTGYMGKTLTTVMDGVYPMMVSQWTKTKMQAMVEHGYHCGGITPFGYRSITAPDASGFHNAEKEPPKRLVPHEDTGAMVADAFAVFLESRSIAAVREHLMAVHTGRKWTTTSVRNILSNEVYAGVQQFGDWRNDNAHAGIVDRATWDEAQKVLASIGSRWATRTVDDFAYYLRGRVRCPHCGCPYTQASHHGRNGRVHYYVCRDAHGRRTQCPVGRLNAERLHYTVLESLQHAVEHRTALHKIIAESESWSTPDDTLLSVRGQLAKKKQFLAVQIGNVTRAISEGGNFSSLLATLGKLEREQEETNALLEEKQNEIAAATVKRPTAEQVQQVWGNLLSLWDTLTEPERGEVLQAVVVGVEVTEKKRVTLELATIPAAHASWFNLTYGMGAGSSVNSNLSVGVYPPLRDLVPLRR